MRPAADVDPVIVPGDLEGDPADPLEVWDRLLGEGDLALGEEGERRLRDRGERCGEPRRPEGGRR